MATGGRIDHYDSCNIREGTCVFLCAVIPCCCISVTGETMDNGTIYRSVKI